MRHRLIPKTILSAGLLLSIAVLAGCGSSEPQNVTIKGELRTSDNAPVPKHASAHVSLVQHGDKPGERRIVAERSLHDLGKKPIHFTLTVGRALIKANGHFGLNAQILDSKGVVRWATPIPVEFNPLKTQKSVSLMLQATALKASDALKPYRCSDGFQFVAETTEAKAILRLANRRVVLEAHGSNADSHRQTYADGHGNQFESAGADASLRLDGHSHNACESTAHGTTVGTGAAGKNGAADTQQQLAVPSTASSTTGSPTK